MLRLKRPTLPKPMIEVLTDEGLIVVNSINPNTFLGLRLLTCTLLILDTGIPGQRAARAQADDINWQNDTLVVWGKGSKQRLVGFDPQTKKYPSAISMPFAQSR